MRYLVLVIALLLPARSQAQPVEVAMGRQLAQTWCAECHQVAPGTPLKDNVPAFVAIATRPGTTSDSLRGFLRKPHGRMPDFSLTETNIQSLVAYILSLKTE